MRPVSLDEIRRAIHGRWRTSPTTGSVSAVSIDTRTAKGGDLFVAIKGDTHDGHAYLATAAGAGCEAAIVRLDVPLDDELLKQFPGGVIGVADTITALGELGAMWRGQMAAEVVAVTGSVGKTTVKRMIHHILSRRLTGSDSPKSFNNNIGVPLTLLAVAPKDDYVVCELGSNAPGEIATLTKIVKPGVAVITSVGPSHLERLQSVERVAVEKASILSELRPAGLAVVWADSPELARAIKPYEGGHIIRFGASDQADLRLTDHTSLGLTQRFQVNGHLWVDLPLPGRHNAMNALAALAVARRFGFEEHQAAAALADFQAPQMRMDARTFGEVTLINDCYNANPMSMAAALDVLSHMPAKRRVFVAGEMRELGESGPEYHRTLGRGIAQGGIELLITVGALGRYIHEGAAEVAGPSLATRTYDSAERAAGDVPQWLTPGDVVLVKASRAVGLERVAESVAAAATGGLEKKSLRR